MDNGTGRNNAQRTPYVSRKPVADRLPYCPPGEMPKVVALLKEIKEMKRLRDEATDGATIEEMQVELMKLVTELNNIFGTDHIIIGSKMTVLNEH